MADNLYNVQSTRSEPPDPKGYQVDGKLTSKLSLLLIVRLVLGTSLIIASCLKVSSLWMAVDAPHDSLRLPAAALYLAIAVELSLGIWLVARPITFASWTTSVIAFSVFAAVCLRQISIGVKVCGCFGALAPSPLIALGFDIVSILALLAFRPAGLSTKHLNPDAAMAMPGSVAGQSLVGTLCATALFLLGTTVHGFLNRGDAGGVLSSRPQRVREPRINLRRIAPLLPIIFSRLAPPRFDVLDSETTASGFPGFLGSLRREMESQQRLSLTELTTADLRRYKESANGLSPPIVLTKAGAVLVVLGSHLLEGDVYYECLEGLAVPFLSPSDGFDRQVDQIWQFAYRPDSIELTDVGLKPDRFYHSFGPINLANSTTTYFRLTNTSGDRLTLADARASCGCVHFEAPSHKDLEPGEAFDLPVSVEADYRPFRHFVFLTATNVQTHATIKCAVSVMGSAIGVASVSPQKVDFGSLARRGAIRRNIVLTEPQGESFEISNVTNSDGTSLPFKWRIGDISPSGRPPARVHQLELELDPETLPWEARTGNIRIHTTSARKPTCDVEYSSIDYPLIQLSPSALAFGTVRSGASRECFATLNVDSEVTELPTVAESDTSAGGFVVTNIKQTSERQFQVCILLTATDHTGPVTRQLNLRVPFESDTRIIPLSCTALISP